LLFGLAFLFLGLNRLRIEAAEGDQRQGKAVKGKPMQSDAEED